ncbi:MAG TPA: S8 family serine peptidase [Bryobacteraceae bacterium]|nr:S8 family serine peptidase [Bryobacteraceae bacterium]
MRKLACVAFAIFAATAFAQPHPHVPSRLLVGFKQGVPASQVDAVVGNLRGLSHEQIQGTNVHAVSLPTNADENAFSDAFKNRPEVEFVEFDEIVPPAAVIPNDPYYAAGQTPYLSQLSVSSAWSTTTGSSSVVIAIIDSGVDGTHPDLASKMVAGWNIYGRNSDTSDVYGHGTEVAGTAAADTNNGIGVAGVCWQCLIMPVRITDKTGYATYSNMASGISWAASHGARVANLSFEASTSSTVTAAAQTFVNAGGVVTIAAGNEGIFVSSPSNAYALTVGAIMTNNALYNWSNYGNIIDLVAPGCASTTTNGGGYGAACGTSVAAPLVAGVAGLLFSTNPSLTGQEVMSMLKQSADDLGAPGWDTTFGWGEVDAYGGVKMASTGSSGGGGKPNVSITTPAPNTTVSGMVTTTASASSSSSTIASVAFLVDNGSLCTVTASPYTCGWNSGNYTNGRHNVSATARDSLGNSTTATVTVTVSNGTDVTPPSVSITSPLPGTTVSKSVTVTTSATDNVGVVSVDLYVDGARIATDTAAPFNFTWNTSHFAHGSHTLQAAAHDAAGNTGTSALVTVYK